MSFQNPALFKSVVTAGDLPMRELALSASYGRLAVICMGPLLAVSYMAGRLAVIRTGCWQ